jgi:hypothetical protein
MHHNYHYFMKFLVLMAASMISLCSLIGTDKHFQRCILHRRTTSTRLQGEISH